MSSRIISAEKGMGRVLLEMIFQLADQFVSCSEEENRVLLKHFVQLFVIGARSGALLASETIMNF